MKNLTKKTISAGAVVINKNGEVLISSQWGKSWSLPKGHVEVGESLKDAVIREVYEETGVNDIVFFGKLGSYGRYKMDLNNSDDKSEMKMIHMYLCFANNDKITIQSESNPEAKWLSPSKIESTLTHPKDKNFYRKILPSINIFIENITSVYRTNAINKLEYIIFDLGEVLYTGKALSKIAKKNKVPLSDFLVVFNSYKDEGMIGLKSAESIWKECFNKLGIRYPAKNFSRYFVAHLERITETHSLIEKLKNKYKLAILTNIFDGYLEELVKSKFVNLKIFTHIIESCKIKCQKPEKKIYVLTQKIVKTDPKKILFIDDVKENIIAAKSQGWNAVLFDPVRPKISINLITYLLKNES